MVLGIVFDAAGIPMTSEMWPGDTAEVTTLDLVTGRLEKHFGIGKVCVVASAGMISKKQIAAIEAHGWRYIVGARLPTTKEVGEVMRGDDPPFGEIEVERQRPKPMKLEVKKVGGGEDKEGTGRDALQGSSPTGASSATSRRNAMRW